MMREDNLALTPSCEFRGDEVAERLVRLDTATALLVFEAFSSRGIALDSFLLLLLFFFALHLFTIPSYNAFALIP